jgi:hypothetical protein
VESCINCREPATEHDQHCGLPVCASCRRAPATASELAAALKAMHDRYSWVVWYMRHDSARAEQCLPPDVLAGVMMSLASVEDAYGDSIPDDDWDHGFNCGVLAALRYVMMAQSHGIKAAQDEFPNLDS